MATPLRFSRYCTIQTIGGSEKSDVASREDGFNDVCHINAYNDTYLTSPVFALMNR